ncbi:hypothetical protein SHIRM173S_08322 [Streptomyces hirsutus]
METLSDLADLAREAAPDEDTVLVLIEQEDGWFGVVRVDGEDDPRIYVSDAAAAARSSYGEILLTDKSCSAGNPGSTAPTWTPSTSTARRTVNRTTPAPVRTARRTPVPPIPYRTVRSATPWSWTTWA